MQLELGQPPDASVFLELEVSIQNRVHCVGAQGSPCKAASPHSELGFGVYSATDGGSMWELKGMFHAERPFLSLLSSPHQTPFPSAGKTLNNYTRKFNDPAMRWPSAQGVDIEVGLSCQRCVGYNLGQFCARYFNSGILWGKGEELLTWFSVYI